MDPTAATKVAFDGLVALTALAAAGLAYRLSSRRGAAGARRLAGALAVTAVVLAYFALDQWLAPTETGPGTWWDLGELLVACVAAVVPVLLVGWALHHPRPLALVRKRPRADLVALAVPAFALLFLLATWPGAAPADPAAVGPQDPAFAEWRLWFTQYDAVEDSTMWIVVSTYLAAGVACLALLAYRSLRPADGAEEHRANQLLAALVLPGIATGVLLLIAFLFQASLPPQSPWLDALVSEGLVDTVLPGSLLVVPQLLWALSVLRSDPSPARRTDARRPSPAS